MNAPLQFLEQRSKAVIISLGTGLLGLVAVADVATGPHISSAIFYVVPISIVAWYAGGRWGVLMSVAGAVLWYLADRTAGGLYGHAAIPVWNAMTRLALFLLLAYLLSLFHTRLRDEQQRAITDPLTGLANHRAFYQTAERESRRARRYQHPFSVAYIDIDDFKHVNDAFGHAAGDVLLQKAAEVMRTHTRDSDQVARLGGDEFAILLVETDGASARRAVEELRLQLLTAMTHAGWPITFSIGVVTWTEPPSDVQTMVTAADRLMYSVKKAGKNGLAYSIGEAA